MTITAESVKTMTDNDLVELLKYAEYLADRKAYKEGKPRAEPSFTITILKAERERRKELHAD